MATRSLRRPKAVSSPDAGPAEDTGSRIRAYLASMQPMKGIGTDSDAEICRATSVILQLASSAHGMDSPAHRLTRQEALDVIAFMRHCEPKSPRTWWSDPDNAPSHWTGWGFVLGAIEDALRGPAGENVTLIGSRKIAHTPERTAGDKLNAIQEELRIAGSMIDVMSMAMSSTEQAPEWLESLDHNTLPDMLYGITQRIRKAAGIVDSLFPGTCLGGAA